MAIEKQTLNILGTKLQLCSTNPKTGYFRDGFCKTDNSDHGTHVVCAVMTKEFLEFTLSMGNDLLSPNPYSNFPGLKPGDSWCLCALRWREAFDAGVAPPVKLESTNIKILEFIAKETLLLHKFVEN